MTRSPATIPSFGWVAKASRLLLAAFTLEQKDNNAFRQPSGLENRRKLIHIESTFLFVWSFTIKSQSESSNSFSTEKKGHTSHPTLLTGLTTAFGKTAAIASAISHRPAGYVANTAAPPPETATKFFMDMATSGHMSK